MVPAGDRSDSPQEDAGEKRGAANAGQANRFNLQRAACDGSAERNLGGSKPP